MAWTSTTNWTITGLFYADDIALFAPSEEILLLMFDVADQFAKKWNFKFNGSKSKVFIVGKRWSEKRWKLGDHMLEEAKSYKYLGVLLNRRLQDSTHIDYVDTKATKLNSYIRYTLSLHSDINRVDFGNSIWNKAALPSLRHASGIWFNKSKASKDKLLSAQYKCGKAVLKLRSKPARIAICMELGWLSITDELDMSRIAYFNYLQSLDDNRLSKQIFIQLLELHNEGTETPFDYFKNIKDIFIRHGVDQMFHEPDSNTRFKNFIQNSHPTICQQEVNKLPSLRIFEMLKSDCNCSSYLKSKAPFNAIQLKMKLRTGVLGLGADLHRQHRGDGHCKFCLEYESPRHFILQCKAYQKERLEMYLNLEKAVDPETFNMILQSPELALVLLLGDHDDIINEIFLNYLSHAWLIQRDF